MDLRTGKEVTTQYRQELIAWTRGDFLELPDHIIFLLKILLRFLLLSHWNLISLLWPTSLYTSVHYYTLHLHLSLLPIRPQPHWSDFSPLNGSKYVFSAFIFAISFAQNPFLPDVHCLALIYSRSTYWAPTKCRFYCTYSSRLPSLITLANVVLPISNPTCPILSITFVTNSNYKLLNRIYFNESRGNWSQGTEHRDILASSEGQHPGSMSGSGLRPSATHDHGLRQAWEV